MREIFEDRHFFQNFLLIPAFFRGYLFDREIAAALLRAVHLPVRAGPDQVSERVAADDSAAAAARLLF